MLLLFFEMSLTCRKSSKHVIYYGPWFGFPYYILTPPPPPSIGHLYPSHGNALSSFVSLIHAMGPFTNTMGWWRKSKCIHCNHAVRFNISITFSQLGQWLMFTVGIDIKVRPFNFKDEHYSPPPPPFFFSDTELFFKRSKNVIHIFASFK